MPYLPSPVYKGLTASSDNQASFTPGNDQGSACSTPTKAMEVLIGEALKGCPNIRVTFNLKTNGTGTGYGQVYKNGSAFGTQRSTTVYAYYVTFSEDLQFTTGDYVQVYCWNIGGGVTYTNNLKIQGKVTV